MLNQFSRTELLLGKEAMNKLEFYYNIYKDIYVFFKEYCRSLWKTLLKVDRI